MKVGNTLKSERESAGITQTELARRVKTNQSYISSIEANAKNPTLSFIGKLCWALDVSLSSFVKKAECID